MTVRFASEKSRSNVVVCIENRKDAERAAGKNYWYNSSEIKAMRESAKDTACMVSLGVELPADHTTRGIEMLLSKKELERSMKAKEASMKAVLKEQSRNHKKKTSDSSSESIAKSYHRATAKSLEEALQRAKEDERAARRHMDEDYDQIQALMKGVKIQRRHSAISTSGKNKEEHLQRRRHSTQC